MKKTIVKSFDFCDWEKAFEYFEKNSVDNSLVMVISTHEYSSGYWVESDVGQESNQLDIVYRDKEVTELKTRVQNEITTAKSESRGVRFTT